MNGHLTEDEAECIAQHITNRLVERMSDEKTVDMITTVWAKYLDRIIGRGFRKVLWICVVFLVGIAFLKIETLLPFFGVKS